MIIFNIYSVDNNPFALKDNYSFDLTKISWRPTKDPDIHRTIKVSLEDIFHGKIFDETIRR